MYRDNSLMPKEMVRLAALGTLAMAGPMSYADLASSVRHFTSRIVGPTLELMGTSIELLRLEGLLDGTDGGADGENGTGDGPLRITEAGRRELAVLLRASVRAPTADPLNKLAITLKLRFLHLLVPEERLDEVRELAGLFEAELARLRDLRQAAEGEPGFLAAWLDHDIAQVQAALAWFQSLAGKVV